MRKYKVNESYFENIDSEEKAYWLGFIFADGCVYSNKCVAIELAIKDENHLLKFISHLDSNYILSYPKNRNSCKLLIGSVKMVNDLLKYGCTSKKSLTLKFPDNINEDLKRHFIRGYFDGDGCISRSESIKIRKDRGNKSYHTITWTTKVLGTIDFLQSIVKTLDLPINKLTSDGTKGFQLKFGGTNKPFIMLNKLYENSNIYLDRKFELYNIFKEELKIKNSHL